MNRVEISSAGVPSTCDGTFRRGDGDRYTARQKYALLRPCILRRDMRDDPYLHRKEASPSGNAYLHTVVLVATFDIPWKWTFHFGIEINGRALPTYRWTVDEVTICRERIDELSEGCGINRPGEHEFGRVFYQGTIAMLWRVLTEEEEKFTRARIAEEVASPRVRLSYGTIEVPGQLLRSARHGME